MARPGRNEGERRPARTRGRPSSETVARIDAAIVDAARNQFFEHGYAGTSMAMVVKAAGVSKTTLYARYATKAELFQATVRLTLDRVANMVLSGTERTARDLATGLADFGNAALRISTSPFWANYERLVYAEGPQFPELTYAVAERIDIGIANVTRFVTECAERDGIPCRDPTGIATVYVMALRGFHSAAVLRVHELSEEERDGFVQDLVAKLIVSRASW